MSTANLYDGASAQPRVASMQASDKNVSIGGVTATVSTDTQTQEIGSQSFNESTHKGSYEGFNEDADFAPEVDSAPLEQLAEELAQKMKR